MYNKSIKDIMGLSRLGWVNPANFLSASQSGQLDDRD